MKKWWLCRYFLVMVEFLFVFVFIFCRVFGNWKLFYFFIVVVVVLFIWIKNGFFFLVKACSGLREVSFGSIGNRVALFQVSIRLG